MATTKTSMIQRAAGWSALQSRKVTAVGLAGMLGVVPLAFSPVASAHDVVLGSTPEDGAVVEEFPETIELEFSGIPQDLFNTVALSNADTGDILYSGEPDVQERLLVLDLPDGVDRSPGNYTLGFQITSSDGHATKGSINFEVTGGEAASGSATSSAPTPVAETPEANPATDSLGIEAPWNWVLGVVGVLVIAGAIVMMIAKGRNSK